MAAWLEHAECQLQAVDQVFFAVGDGAYVKMEKCCIVMRKDGA